MDAINVIHADIRATVEWNLLRWRLLGQQYMVLIIYQPCL